MRNFEHDWKFKREKIIKIGKKDWEKLEMLTEELSVVFVVIEER